MALGTNVGGLVPGGIEADFYTEAFGLQHFARSTRFTYFSTAPYIISFQNDSLFDNILTKIHKNYYLDLFGQILTLWANFVPQFGQLR